MNEDDVELSKTVHLSTVSVFRRHIFISIALCFLTAYLSH